MILIVIFIASFCGHLPYYHWRMASVTSQIIVVLVKRELYLSYGSVDWLPIGRPNYPKYLEIIKKTIYFSYINYLGNL